MFTLEQNNKFYFINEVIKCLCDDCRRYLRLYFISGLIQNTKTLKIVYGHSY